MTLKPFKKITVLAVICSLTLLATSCNKEKNDPEPIIDPAPDYAMTVKINGVLKEFNNTFGTNEASTTTIFTYYPEEEYILLQGKKGIGGDLVVQMWIKRTDLAVGTYQVGYDTDGEDTHVDLLDNSNSEIEVTSSGSITVTSIDTVLKRVKGTFEFTATFDSSPTFQSDYELTDGTFDYFYDVE